MSSGTPKYAANGDIISIQTLAQNVMASFDRAGYLRIDPPVLQPADVLLDILGEEIRRRLYVFEDPAGEEMCLRPDITIPTCRVYLDNLSKASPELTRKLSYYGRAFRHQKRGTDRPNEILQAGVESFGENDRAKADAAVLELAVRTCKEQGLETFNLKFGDVGLFFRIVDALDISEQWRARLKRYIWQPDEFDQLTGALSAGVESGQSGPGQGLLAALRQLSDEEARATLEDLLRIGRIQPVGARTVNEISERLLAQAAEGRDAGPDQKTSAFIRSFLQIETPASKAVSEMRRVLKRADLDAAPLLQEFERRLAHISDAGFELDTLTFEADFGRKLEYYTGFVFELTSPYLDDYAQISGGGRYDSLLTSLGATTDIPAVGCMIRLERLHKALALKNGKGAQK